MLEHALRLAGDDVRVGTGRGDPMESELPFGLVTQALAAAGGPDLLAGGAAAGASPGAAFYQAQPWIEEQGSRPLLLALDDLHWADNDSLALLSFLCRRIAGRSVAVLGTLRPWPPRAREVSAALVGGGHARMERLRPLSEAAARALIAAQAGDRPGVAVVAQALRLCNGNCLLLEQAQTSWLTVGPGDSLRAVVRARLLSENVDEALRARVGSAWGFIGFLCGDPAGLR